MHKHTPGRTAAAALVEQLVINGVKHVFCVPGESFLPVLDALRDSGITMTVCRHEGGAAMMAEAIGKVTGRPGVCFVTRGPGATNASAGIHIAQQDSTPMIMFVGQVETSVREREAFQELDYRAVFGSMTKWTAEIDDPNRITEFVSRAFYTASSGRPGPVVLALPKDILSERVTVATAPAFEPVETSPGEEEMTKLGELLAEAKESAVRARRQPLVRDRAPPDPRIRRCDGNADRHQLSALDAVRSPAPALCRRPRARPQPETGGARQGRRSPGAGRRAARRNSLAGLFAAFESVAANETRAYPSRRRGNRPGVPAASGDPRLTQPLCRGAEAPPARGEAGMARQRRGRPCRFSRLDRQRPRRSPATSISARS